MHFSSAIIPFLAVAGYAAAVPLSPGQGIDPSCFPISKLTAQLSDFQKFSALVLINAPQNFNQAKKDATSGVESIVSPIDLLNPKVQQLQNTILSNLALVGSTFKDIEGAPDAATQIKLATQIQGIL